MTSTQEVTVAAALREIASAHGIDERAIAAAHRASAGVARHTPLVRPVRPSPGAHGGLLLKAENLQLTGSYKLRGALNKMRALGPACPGVVAASAGNHAQGLAYAARAMGVSCVIYMPAGAPLSKVSAIRELGAEIHQQGATVDDCFALAAEDARSRGRVLVHPFDDPDIIVGQGGVGLEILQDVPGLAQVVIPVGGGGLAAGIAVAIKSRRPEVRLVGVQARSSAPFVEPAYPPLDPQPAGRPPTIADGVAVKRPGVLTGAVLGRLLDELIMVEEQSIADAMVWVMEQAKLVVEGAGAVSVAALLEGQVAPIEGGETVAVLSGGNVDVRLIAAVVRNHESRERRRIRLAATIADSPGSLAALLGAVAQAGGNLIDIHHVRDGSPLELNEVLVQLTIETHGARDSDQLLAALRAGGFGVSEAS